MSFNDFKTFWGEDSKIVKQTKILTRNPYKLPEGIETKDGKNAFEEIGRYLIVNNMESLIENGWIDLDKAWAESQDPKIVAQRQNFFDEHPKPFCQRKAYVVRVHLTTKKETTDEGVIEKKVIKNPKITEDYALIGGFVEVYKNEQLGYDKETEDEKNPKSLYVSLFMNPDLAKKKLFPYIKWKAETDDVSDIIFFGITTHVKRGDLKDNSSEPISVEDYWHSINLDDVFFIVDKPK